MHLGDPQITNLGDPQTAMKRQQDLCSPHDSGGSQEVILLIWDTELHEAAKWK